ncbi:hypothetical protein LY76DRAFT_676741 [Colletotrichum caudatum]|nr:hypothetical protein LY76DRAFT_676741 [Colletotrichum caudatum]
MDRPRPPSVDEANNYYYGLPSSPRLIARTSSDIWTPEQLSNGWGTKRKVLRTVGTHPILASWNDSEGLYPLSQTISNVLDKHIGKWNAIDIIRLGFEDADDLPVVMSISMDPLDADTSWESAYDAAFECKAVLESLGISDVHVEMKESGLTRLLSTNPVEIIHLDNLDETWPTEFQDFGYSISDGLGNAIATVDEALKEGTKCLYLRVRPRGQDQFVTCLLTCRHVLFGSNEQDYWVPNTGTRPPTAIKFVIQPGKKTIQTTERTLKELESSAAKRINALEIAKLFKDPVTVNQQLQAQQQAQSRIQEIRLHFASPRRLGHVEWVQKYHVGENETLMDWGLVLMDPHSHEVDLTDLRNRNVGVDIQEPDMMERFTLMPPVPAAEIEHLIKPPRMHGVLEADQPAPSLLVVKRGRTTGVTFGVLNQAKSVLRTPSGNGLQTFTSREFCVIAEKSPIDPRLTFSGKGDSGACVFDLQGRVVGMVTSGIGRDEIMAGTNDYGLDQACDVTYVTPMDYILADMSKCGLEVDII